MSTPDEDAIGTFISITGASEATAVQKLEEHHGNLNVAIDAYFNDNDRNQNQASTNPLDADAMDVDDPIEGDGHAFEDASESTMGQLTHARATVVTNDDSNDSVGNTSSTPFMQTSELGNAANEPSAPPIVDLPDYSNDIEEEMVQAAIEASKRDAAVSNQQQSTLEVGSSSVQQEADDEEKLPSDNVEILKDTEEFDVSQPLSPRQGDNGLQPQIQESEFPSEWGGISSEEHDEAVMLEAAMFGGIPEGSSYHFPRPMANGYLPRNDPRPPSPSLTAQRLLREQQDDEYLAALQADREKELKAMEEAEAALADERRREEELHRREQEEQEIERNLEAKEASLPQEPTKDDENAVNLLVRMPDGSRRGRRFLKSDHLQYIFDFIDVGRGVKPGSYRLVRPYPRQAFSEEERSSRLDELGLTSKQEALYLELI